MAATSQPGAVEQIDMFEEFFRNYYDPEIRELSQYYPKEQRSLEVDFGDLFQFNPDLADDYLSKPNQLRQRAEEALRVHDLPIDISLSRAHVRLHNLDPAHTFYPGRFSITDRHKNFPYLAVEGQVEKATDIYAKMDEAGFECQLCGTITHVPQSDGDFQEPHECKGCERQGPFEINFSQSDFVDAQTVRIAEPPEIVRGGSATTIDVSLEDDLCDTAEPGDRVTVTGQIRLEQDSSGQTKNNRFDSYLDAHHIQISETDFEDIDISEEDKEEIEAIASGEYGDLFNVVTESIATDLTGEKYDLIKEGMFLSLVGGATAELENGREVRGMIHQLMIGEASTGKSTLLREAAEISPRSVYANGKGATAAGMTATAVQDDFGDSGAWTVEAGALVQASGGLACVDEIDKVRDDVQDSMHGAMADMKVDVNKADISTTLPAETTVFGGGNPKYARWDEYADESEQVDLSETLLSRFALIWKLRDVPDEETDTEKAEHTLSTKEDAKRRRQKGISPEGDERVVDLELLRKYIAHAKQQPDPRIKDEAVYEKLRDAYVTMRGMNGYDKDAAVPITLRKLQDMHRLAEASALSRLSETVDMEDVKRAKRLVGESLQDYGINEDGNIDADIVEVGESKPQRDRVKSVKSVIRDVGEEHKNGAPIDIVIERAGDIGIDDDTVEHEIEKLKQKGDAYEPTTDHIRLT